VTIPSLFPHAEVFRFSNPGKRGGVSPPVFRGAGIEITGGVDAVPLAKTDGGSAWERTAGRPAFRQSSESFEHSTIRHPVIPFETKATCFLSQRSAPMPRICTRRLSPRHVGSLLLSLCVCSGVLPASADDKADKAAATGKTKMVKAGGLTLTVPEAWKEKEPSSNFRAAEIEVPAAGDDKSPGEFVVFNFGAGGGGGVQANVDRWIGQFDSEGRKVKVWKGMASQGEYTLVELTGTYKKPIGPPIQMKSKPVPGWRVLGVVLQAEGGPYFIKLDGPDKTINAAANDFRASFGGNAKDEKEVKSDAKTSQTDSDDRPIVDRLKKKISVDFRRVPLRNAFDYVGKEIGVAFKMDGDAIKSVGATQNMPQDFKIDDAPASVVIERIFAGQGRNLGLILVVDEKTNVAIVTNPVFAEKRGETAFPLK
jgi:gluconolactonase